MKINNQRRYCAVTGRAGQAAASFVSFYGSPGDELEDPATSWQPIVPALDSKQAYVHHLYLPLVTWHTMYTFPASSLAAWLSFILQSQIYAVFKLYHQVGHNFG